MSEELAQTKITKSEESPKTRKRKFDPESLWAKCQVCKEPGNLGNLIRHGIPVKSSVGIVWNGAFNYVYFCSENCQGLFSN